MAKTPHFPFQRVFDGLAGCGPFKHTGAHAGRATSRRHEGDYHDAIENRKAAVHLITFEAGLGGMSPYAARRLRRKGREAAESGADPTDYTTSPTARSFVPYYAQRLSMACVMYGASAILKSLKRKAARRRSAAVVA